MASIFFIVNGRFGAYIVDRLKEICIDLWRRDSRCHMSERVDNKIAIQLRCLNT